MALKNTCEGAVLLETLQAAIIFQRFLLYFMKTDIQENMNFLCDTVYRLPVGGDLRKSFKTVLNEVHFEVNLHSFPLLLVPRANSSPVKSFVPCQAKQLRKLPLLLDTSAIALVCIFSSILNHS